MFEPDLLISADMMVSDPDAVASMLVDRLGILSHPNSRQAFPDHPYVAWFLRVHKSLAVAPTRIEPQGHRDVPSKGDPAFPIYLDSLKDFHGRARPFIPHSTVIVTRDLDAVMSRLLRERVPYRIAPITPEMPSERVWIGSTFERPQYDPSYDGGLATEVLPMWVFDFPEAVFDASEPVDPAPGAMIRVVQREFLVRDLDDVLRQFASTYDWAPRAPIERFPEEGFRRARLHFALPHSATIDLVEPTRWNSPDGMYLSTWGPGPHTIRIAVHDLGAKADDLTARNTRFAFLDEDAARPRRILVEADDLDGMLFEFCEYEPLSRAGG